VHVPCGDGLEGDWHNDRTGGFVTCTHHIPDEETEVIWTSRSDLPLGIAHGRDLPTIAGWWTDVNR